MLCSWIYSIHMTFFFHMHLLQMTKTKQEKKKNRHQMKWGLPKEVSDLRIAQTLVSYTNKDWIQSWMAANWETKQSVQIIIIMMWSLIPESSVTAENQMAKKQHLTKQTKTKKKNVSLHNLITMAHSLEFLGAATDMLNAGGRSTLLSSWSSEL